jgi:Mg2+-importing ATPase
MLKNITRQLFAQLSRHLPRRLVQRDPLPDARNLAGAPIPASLTERCLNVAAMDENEVWRAFESHPEGLNEAEVEKIRAEHGDNQIPAQSRRRGGCICGPATATRSTCC